MGPWLTPGGEGAETEAPCLSPLSARPTLSSVWPLTLLTAAPPQDPHPQRQAVLYSAGIPGSPSREHAPSRAPLKGVPSPPAARGAQHNGPLCGGAALSFLAPAAPAHCLPLARLQHFFSSRLSYCSAWVAVRKDLEAGWALESEGMALTSLGVFGHTPPERTPGRHLC